MSSLVDPSLWPLLALLALLLAALPAFALRVSRHGLERDDRIEQRKTGPFLGRFLMYFFLWLVAPIEQLMVKMGISPNALTFTSLALSVAAAVSVGMGRFGLGGWLFLLTGIFDVLDGRVARATSRVSRAGAFYDSVVDRFAEAFFFCGLAWYYRESSLLLLVLAALVGSFMVSYARARGESLGASDGDVGAMQRPERILYLGLGVALSPVLGATGKGEVHPTHLLAVLALALVAISALATAWRRSNAVVRELSSRPSPSSGVRSVHATPVAQNGDSDGESEIEALPAAASRALTAR